MSMRRVKRQTYSNAAGPRVEFDFGGIRLKHTNGLSAFMKSRSLVWPALILALAAASANPAPAEVRATFVYETPEEFFGSGDFDGDGRSDLIIFDKQTGKYRLGYQLTNGVISWVDCRPTGEKLVTGF